jgi:hypothetical protein
MFVLGFQEIVPLTAQQIVQTDPEKRCACLSLPQEPGCLRIYISLDSTGNENFWTLLEDGQIRSQAMFC